MAWPAARDATLILRPCESASSGAEERAAKGLLARPTDGTVPIGHAYSVPSEFTCGADMCFHWVETTADAATPEWLATVQATWEVVWSQEIDALEYRPPRFDGATDQTDGPTGVDKRKLDVYVLDLGEDGVFGYCAALTGSLTPPVYCAVDNDYAEFGTSQIPEAFLEVTSGARVPPRFPSCVRLRRGLLADRGHRDEYRGDHLSGHR